MRQGCLASLSLFNIFINDIMDGLNGLGVEVPGISDVIVGLLFADDLVLFVESVPQLKEMLKNMHKWAQKWGMVCEIDMCEYMVVFGDQDRLKLEELLIGEDRIGWLLVCEVVWEAWESKHSTEALQFYNEFKLKGSREFFKRAMRRTIKLGIVDHRIGVRCPLYNGEGVEVIPLYDHDLREWEVQGDGSQLGLAEGPLGIDTTFEPMPERVGLTFHQGMQWSR
eukprot:Gb_11246 [translate_table: standard]